MALYLLVTIIVITLFITFFKLLIKLTNGWDRSYTCLVGKTAIITGANTGIGFYTAQDFAKRGAKVILACRSRSKAEEARKKIIDATGNSNVFIGIVDFLSLNSVRQFANEIIKREERLDILVNNAGVAGLKDLTTEDGNNLMMQVNHLGPFLLTILLIDLLKKSAPSRIVNVSSVAAIVAKLDPNNLNAVASGETVHYANTKLCNMLFTNELAMKLKNSNVTVNSVQPGPVYTEIGRHAHGIGKIIFHIIAQLFFVTPEEGAQTTLHVALSKEIENISGEYFDKCKIAWLPPMPKVARNENVLKKVWQQSEKLVKLSKEERL